MKTKYKVESYIDHSYRVLEIYEDEDNYDNNNFKQVFAGSLFDCEAFIRLTENGYM